MDKREKAERKKLAAILSVNEAPAVDKTRRAAHIRQLEERALVMDIMAPESVFDKLLRQVSYISPWVWLVQAVVLGICYYDIFRWQGDWDITQMFSMLTPCLVLILMTELTRSFGCNMWEMEAACRYDLRQILAMRMCLVGGTDTLLLVAVYAAYRIEGGSLAQFLVYVMFPFFLMSAVCLWELVCFGKRCSNYLLAATGIFVMICLWQILDSNMLLRLQMQQDSFTLAAGLLTAAAALAFVAAGIRLWYMSSNSGKEGKGIWNLG